MYDFNKSYTDCLLRLTAPSCFRTFEIKFDKWYVTRNSILYTVVDIKSTTMIQWSDDPFNELPKPFVKLDTIVVSKDKR